MAKQSRWGLNGRNAMEDLLEIWRRFADALVEPACLCLPAISHGYRDKDRTEPPSKPRTFFTPTGIGSHHLRSTQHAAVITTSSSPTHLCTPADQKWFLLVKLRYTNPARNGGYIYGSVCLNKKESNVLEPEGMLTHSPVFLASA